MNPPSWNPATLFQAVSDPTRLRLLRLLRRQELNVRELVEVLRMRQPRVSKHLAILHEAGWIRQRREGTWSWYQSTPRDSFPAGPVFYDTVLGAAEAVDSAAEDGAALARVLAEREARAEDIVAGIAGRWDEIRHSYEHPDIQTGALGALADEGLRVIDIGTGTGAMLPLLAQAVDRIVAVDRNQAMLARARQLCEVSGLRRVRFQQADILALPFADASFDVAYCSMVLHHVVDPGAALAEVSRIVRPGGRVVVIAFTRHNLTWMRRQLAHQWLGFDRQDTERILQEAGLTLRQLLVRRRADGHAPERKVARRRRGGPRGGEWTWPDVFLAVAVKRTAGQS